MWGFGSYAGTIYSTHYWRGFLARKSVKMLFHNIYDVHHVVPCPTPNLGSLVTYVCTTVIKRDGLRTIFWKENMKDRRA